MMTRDEGQGAEMDGTHLWIICLYLLTLLYVVLA